MATAHTAVHVEAHSAMHMWEAAAAVLLGSSAEEQCKRRPCPRLRSYLHSSGLIETRVKSDMANRKQDIYKAGTWPVDWRPHCALDQELTEMI